MIEIVRKHLFLLILSIGMIILVMLELNREEEPAVSLLEIQPEEVAEEEIPEMIILVDIKGEVNQPGVYEMKPNARMKDVIEKAGGFTEEANTDLVNLAQKVVDEMSIVIPKIGEESNLVHHPQQGKIRINYATVEDIQKLPGIGPAKAKAIVEYREQHGFFQKVEDLLSVSGIGEKTLEAIVEEIQIP